ncbi:phage head spike fiber domain-containing protein [Mesorhizobium sp. A623]
MIRNRDTKAEVAAQLDPMLDEWGGVAGTGTPPNYGTVRARINAISAYNGLPSMDDGELGGDARSKINAILALENYRKFELDFAINEGLVIGPNGRSGTATSLVTTSRPSVASYFDASGTLRTAANNVLRLDHDPVTHAARGALIEGAATNLAWPSDWSGVSTLYADFTLAQAAGPDGTDTLALITSTNLNGGLAKVVSVPAGDGVTRCASLFFRIGTADTHRLDIGYYGGPTAPYRVAATTFTVSTGIVAGAGGVIDCGGGLYRLWAPLINAAADGHTVCQIVSNVMGASGNTAYTGDLQIEAGSVPTSYIKTTSAAATRAADVVSIPNNGLWADAVTVAMEFSYPVLPTSGFPGLFNFYDSSATSQRMVVFFNPANGAFGLGSVPEGTTTEGSVVVVPAPAIVAGQSASLAARFAKDNFAMSVNGSPLAFDTSGNVPMTDTLRLNPSTPAIHIKRFKLIPAALSNTDMMGLLP